jgi:hypothetical protein
MTIKILLVYFNKYCTNFNEDKDKTLTFQAEGNIHSHCVDLKIKII